MSVIKEFKELRRLEEFRVGAVYRLALRPVFSKIPTLRVPGWASM